MCFQCLYVLSVSSSIMVATQRTSFIWAGKEKYLFSSSSKCAECSQMYLSLRITCFPRSLKSKPTRIFFPESVNELLILRVFFHFMLKSLAKKFTQTIVLYIKFNRTENIFRSLFIESSVPAIL